MAAILITGQGGSAIRADAPSLGIAANLEKPIDDEALLASASSANYRTPLTIGIFPGWLLLFVESPRY
jgi:hypothetical protein